MFVDCSTIDVASAREAHTKAEDAGMLSLDAPVSGGVGGAAGGTLTFMVGGSDAAFEKAKPLFDIMGQRRCIVVLTARGKRQRFATTCCWAFR